MTNPRSSPCSNPPSNPWQIHAPIRGESVCFHSLVSSLVSLVSDSQFAEYKSLPSLVRFIPRHWNRNSERIYFGGAPKSLQVVTAAMKLKDAYSLKEKLWPT